MATPDEYEPDELEMQALLYACGDLNAGEARAFEVRLAGDQPAREALASAVGCLPPLFDNARPDPVYRRRVRQRLAGRSKARSRLRGWACAAGGAAAASLVFLLFGTLGQWFPHSAASDQTALAASGDEQAGPASDREAVHFADLTTVDRLSRVHYQEASRKRKNEEWRQRHPILEAIRPMMPPMTPVSPASMM
jgi:hypothetical protein